MARPKKIDSPDYRFRFKQAFENNTCFRDLAKDMEISERTARRYGKELGLSYPAGRPVGSESLNPLRGGLVQWIKEHPDEHLPTKVKDIVELTGLTKDQVKCFLYRRKKRMVKRAKLLGNIAEWPGAIGYEGQQDEPFWFKNIDKYKMSVLYQTGEVKIDATMKNGKRIVFKTTLSRLENYKSIMRFQAKPIK